MSIYRDLGVSADRLRGTGPLMLLVASGTPPSAFSSGTPAGALSPWAATSPHRPNHLPPVQTLNVALCWKLR
jgi:hypothetical protein